MPREPFLNIFEKLRRKPWRETWLAVWGRTRLFLGLTAPMRTCDRKLLEERIIPFFAKRGVGRVLFVGTDWFTKHYDRLFPESDYWTIEIEPKRRKFGAAQHIVDSLEHLDRHFPAEHFDLIICNGVYGWGLNDLDACEQAFHKCYECLRPRGVLVLGWNNLPERRPVPLESIPALGRFHRMENSPLGTWRHSAPTESQHTYDFYIKHESRD